MRQLKHIWKAFFLAGSLVVTGASLSSAEPTVTVQLNEAELTDGAVIESIDDVLISTSETTAATLTGRLSAQETDQLDLTKISLPILDPVYMSVSDGQSHFRLLEDNCSTKQLAPGTTTGSTCDVTLTPRATAPGFFTGKLLVKAGSYQTEIPLSGQARNFCAPEPAIMMTSSCSQPCGGGTKTTTFTDGCGATWTDTSTCNTQACDAYNWNTSQYGNCSEVCNGGIQFRDVWCERFSDGARVADSFCEDDIKPSGNAQCNTMTCYRDYKVCGWIPDIPVELAYRGFRLQVVDEDNPDAYRYVSNTCEPDTSQSTPIDARGGGCEAVHFDYPNDEISYGAKKWFVTATDEPLTQCIESTDITYTWNLVAVGWDEKDEDLQAFRTRRHQITVDGQDIFVSDEKVHEGEEPVAYQLINTETIGTGESYQEVCMVYENSYVEETYLRPAGTNFVRNAGPGEPIYVSGEDQHMVDGQCIDIIKTYLIAATEDTVNIDVAAELSAQGWDGIEPVHLEIEVAEGVTVSSNSTSTAAIVIPALPEESTASLTNNGMIIGRGGEGGKPTSHSGKNGGPAVSTQTDLSIANAGIIGGGGGGGGGATGTAATTNGNCFHSCIPLGAGAGGGAGAPPGSGGNVASSMYICSGGTRYGTGGGNHGSAGSLLTGGSGGPPFSCSGNTGATGGRGGDLGQDGSPGTKNSRYDNMGAPGKAGAAVVTNGSTLTWTANGDVRGRID